MFVTFIGHRKIEITNELIVSLKATIIKLITLGATNFLFGSKSQFNDLCYSITVELKKTFSNIKIIYVRAEFENINQHYTNYLLQSYDETYFPSEVIGAGRLSYIIRNKTMIDKSDYVVMYYNSNYVPQNKKIRKNLNNLSNSGTHIAYQYAKSKNKKIINLYKD